MIPGTRRRKTAGPIGMVVRLAVILLLGACAWWVWVKDPLNPDRRRAGQFCESVTAGMSPVEIMQAATAKGATGFATPRPDELVVYFGKRACAVEIDAGRGSGV